MCALLGVSHTCPSPSYISPHPHHTINHPTKTPTSYTQLALWFIILLPPLVRIWAWIWPKSGAPVFLPFWWLRTIFFKLAVDLQHMPALQQLVVALIRWLLSQVGL